MRTGRGRQGEAGRVRQGGSGCWLTINTSAPARLQFDSLLATRTLCIYYPKGHYQPLIREREEALEILQDGSTAARGGKLSEGIIISNPITLALSLKLFLYRGKASGTLASRSTAA